ncbi:TPM domain-containing protein [Pseudarthrobacter raffinosi]|uniref:TPM domain-containing protein n=1 Tax=Pseudarthrobacter raffinosi TaxID=2953651 RepID=UPI00208EBB41|nr:TPM domain-containing protein [Pseudarthrobacter sp. MDT3-9]MCO4252420.1 TPM domain-containing protein [Pseudarthrobacter sp. MDT3-9]
MMGGYGSGMDVSWLFWLLPVAVAVLVAALAARALSGGTRRRGTGSAPGQNRNAADRSNARRILDQRYAGGELDTQQYRDRLALLTGPGIQPEKPGINPRDGGPGDQPAAPSLPELKQRAVSLLIAADDAVRSGQQEAGFAQAQFGDVSVAPYAKALANAKSDLSESFKLQQQLDDAIPATEEQQWASYTEIISRCESANHALAEQKVSFDSLRELEKNAPQALELLRAGRAEAAAKVADAEHAMTGLRARYSDAAVAPVSDNIAQARERLKFLDTAAQTAQQKLTEADPGAAAIAVRAAEEGLHQTNVLVNAIGKVSHDLDSARTNLDPAVQDAAQDLAQAKATMAAGQHTDLAGPVAGAEAVLNQVQQQLQSGRIDPIAALQRMEAARQGLDQALSGVRNQQDQARRAGQALQQAIMNAQARISVASDYIAARRGGVGPGARTRLAEAQRNLDTALSIQQRNPGSSLTYAQQAGVLASRAAELARSDVQGFGGLDNRGYGGGMFGSRGCGGGLGGAVLGGILIDSILRGGHGGDSGNGAGWDGDSGSGDSL